MKYLITYSDRYIREERSVIIEYSGNNPSWRELQQYFDPNYRCDNLKFFAIGDEIKFKQGE